MLIGVFSMLTLGACGGAPVAPKDPLVSLRDSASASRDGEVVGRWLLGELFVPGGDAARARDARKRLDELPKEATKGLQASLARAVDDEAHGAFQSAAMAHLGVINAARSDASPDAQLAAWFSATRLLALRSSVANLWSKARALVTPTIEQPGYIGWRARSTLVEWWSLDGVHDSAEPVNVLEATSKKYGCISDARMAGPFGHGAVADQHRHFDAEHAGPWPLTFAKDPLRMEAPSIRPVDHRGCLFHANGPGGVYYLEAFVDLPADREVIISAQASTALFVDDTEVLTRDMRTWGIWPRFGAHLRLNSGRHRILARVGGNDTSVRIETANGLPLDVKTSVDPAPPYAITPPELLPDPNVLEPFMRSMGVPPQPGTPLGAPRDTDDPIARAIAAWVAHVDSQDDVSAALMQPLVADPSRATGPALSWQAIFLDKDPIFRDTDAHDLMRLAREAAAKKDPELWWPRYWLALDEAQKTGLSDAAPKLAEIADHFREVGDVLKGLGAIYGRAGWQAEHARAVREAAARFPDDTEALDAYLGLLDDDGKTAEADKVAAHIKTLDPDSEIELSRALRRRDYKAAIKELERIGKERKERKDIAARIAELLTRSGASKESMAKLELAVRTTPADGDAHLALADARLAGGDKSALQRALIDAIHAGAHTEQLRGAIELVDGIDELSAYRIDGAKVIKDYEAAHMTLPGTAARVLDYSTLWIHPDGSARMLEHEILCIQSREAIQELAEQRPRGLVLKIRTIKKDGRELEPEFVEGKQSVTMPHLEVGDYIETETITPMRSDGIGGKRFEGPRWLFREAKIPYFRSEFIVVSPKNRHLDIETGPNVPDPDVREAGALSVRRWRVDRSPALPEEPASAPIEEFLPNVRVGWGIDLDDTIARLVDAAADETPRDPRLVRIAETIASDEVGAKKSDKEKAADKQAGIEQPPARLTSQAERARRIYRWVVENVQAGREDDPRRVVTGKDGNRTEAFLYLCRILGIDANLALVQDRLAAKPRGPMSGSEQYNAVAVHIVTDGAPTWMVVRDKFAPFGYLPSSMRGQPAILLKPGAPHETTTDRGPADGVKHVGKATLRADGSATVEIEQRYEGQLAIALRSGLESLPDARLKEAIETRIVPRTFPGARLVDIAIKNANELDAPLILALKLDVSSFARVRQSELVITLPALLPLGALASFPSRETPLYVSENMASSVGFDLEVTLPAGARVTTDLQAAESKMGRFSTKVTDHAGTGTLTLSRSIELPAGRVQPAEYPAFQDFARAAEAALRREIVISLK
jgi:hypothetical protein